jgi:hypothetical protein
MLLSELLAESYTFDQEVTAMSIVMIALAEEILVTDTEKSPPR